MMEASRNLNLPTTNTRVLGIAVPVLLAGVLFLSATVSGRQAALFLVGSFAGIVLYHAAFGFTSAWRNLLVDGRGGGLRAQMLMLGLTTVVFLPIIASGDLFGAPVRGSVAPVALSGFVGALLFGIGMQLGGGCASGTLYTVGGGSTRMVVTLAGFIGGSVFGAWHQPAWSDQPTLGPISLLERLGLFNALALSLLLFAGIAWLSAWYERRRHGSVATVDRPVSKRSWLTGPWPLVAGAAGLAIVNIATLSLAGRPWGVTSAFVLWGAKLLVVVGVDVAAWPYWQSVSRVAQLEASVFTDVTSVMNIGVMLGALTAAGLAGRFSPVLKVPLRSLAAAVIGGLLLGYGARLAYGCNIGAFFSGVSSSSLHGWLWFASALVGNALGARLRPLFQLR